MKRFRNPVGILGLSLLIPVSTSFALDILWDAGSGDFNTGANWDSGTVPGSGDVAFIANGGTAQISDGERGVTSVFPGWNGQGTLQITGGTLNSTAVTDIGRHLDETATGNFGRIEISGSGVFNAGGSFHLGRGNDDGSLNDVIGEVSLSNSAVVNQSGWVVVGLHGTGVLEISDNAQFLHTGGNIIVGEFATGNGTVTQTGGLLDAGGGEFWVGQNGGTGIYALDGGTLNVGNWFAIGRQNGNGTFTMTGGTVTKIGGGNIELGNSADSVALVNQSGGVMDVISGRIELGQGGAQSTYNLDGGTINISDWLAVGLGGGTATFTMTDGTINKTGGGAMAVGDWGTGTGTFTQSGGVVNLNGGALEIAKSDSVEGTFELSGDAVFNAGDIDFAPNGSSVGLITLADNAALNADEIFLNRNSDVNSAEMHLNGGALTMARLYANPLGGSIVRVNGTLIRATRDEPAFIDELWQLYVDGGGFSIDSNGFAVTVRNPLLAGSGSGSVTKLGEGTVVLAGVLDDYGYTRFTGPVDVQQGRLLIGTANGEASAITVADGAGFGVTVTSLNEQFTSDSLSLGVDSTLDFDLGAFPGSSASPLSLTSLAVNGDVVVNVADGFPELGQQVLVDFSNRTGTGSFVLGELGTGVEATLIESENALILDVTSAASLKWEGDVDGLWDFSSANWRDVVSGTMTAFEDGFPVEFNDDASGTTAIILDETVAPGSLVFDHENLDYTISGSGSITGPIGLIKLGVGSLAVNSVNDYTGPTRIEGGGELVANSINDGGLSSSIGASSADSGNLVLTEGTLSYVGPEASSNRGFTLGGGVNAINVESNLSLGGPVAMALDSQLLVTGPSILTLNNPGAMTLGAGGGGVLQVNSDGLTLDGNGSQAIQVGGEVWVGTATDAEPDLVLNNTSLSADSWIAVGRGHSTTGLTSSFIATNSQVQSNGFSAGYQGELGETNNSVQVITLIDSTVTNNGDSNMAESNGSSTTMVLSGASTFSSGGRFSLAQAAETTGHLTITDDSALTVGAWFNIAEAGTATLTLTGNGSITTSGDFNIADGSGQATFTMADNATVTSNSGVFIGKNGGSTGIANLSGGSLTATSANEFQVGGRGDGTWTQTGGDVSFSGWTAIGRYPDITGILDISGGTFTQVQGDRPIMVAEEGTGILTISETGFVSSTGSGIWIAQGGTGNGTVNLNGGTLQAQRVHGSAGQSAFNFNGGLLQASSNAAADFMANIDSVAVLAGGAHIDSGGANIGILQDLGGAGGLTKIGEGVLTLNGVNTYSGDTTVSGGVLQIDGDNSGATGSVIIEAGGSLGGSGSTGGDVSFAVGGAFTFDGASAAGPLAVAGQLDITNAALTVTGGGLTEPAYVIADYGTLAPAGGPFAELNVPAGYVVDYAYNGNKIALLADGAPPETYEEWVAGFGLDPLTDGAADVDANNDGVANLMAFAMGLSPVEFQQMPESTITDGFLELTYSRSVSASSQVGLVVKFAAALESAWSTEGVEDILLETNGNIETRRARVGVEGDFRGFLRLEATR